MVAHGVVRSCLTPEDARDAAELGAAGFSVIARELDVSRSIGPLNVTRATSLDQRGNDSDPEWTCVSPAVVIRPVDELERGSAVRRRITVAN